MPWELASIAGPPVAGDGCQRGVQPHLLQFRYCVRPAQDAASGGDLGDGRLHQPLRADQVLHREHLQGHLQRRSGECWSVHSGQCGQSVLVNAFRSMQSVNSGQCSLVNAVSQCWPMQSGQCIQSMLVNVVSQCWSMQSVSTPQCWSMQSGQCSQ